MRTIKKTLLILFTVSLIGIMYLNSPYKAQEERRNCTIRIVEAMEVTDYVTLQGNVVERRRKPLYPQSLSRVLLIHVEPGSQVVKGQVLMTLRTEREVDSTTVFYSELKKQLASGNISSEKPNIPNLMGEDGLEYDIISPIDGTVMELNCHVGEQLSSIFPCIVISDLNALGVSAQVREEYSNDLKPGMRCKITIDSVSDTPYKGQISSIAPYASSASVLAQDPTIRVDVEAVIEDPTADIRPGYTAELKISTGPPEMTIVLPYNCVAQDEVGEYVLYLGEGDRLLHSYVQSGRELQDGIEILSGVEIGWHVIEKPEDYRAGEQVRPA